MDKDQFWKLIDQTRIVSKGDSDRHAELLIEALTALPEVEIVDYQRIFDSLDIQAERYDLRDVADLIYGGLGDSGWKDFCAWLIGQGQRIYENALADPETLGEIISVDEREKIKAELLGYAGQIAYQRKTDTEDFIPYIPEDRSISIKESLWKDCPSIEEYDKRFKEKYPKVWEKFNWELSE